jgi:iron complex outermembrane receptor protein
VPPLLGTSVQAQIEEVIVTANKREQTLQDIPMSVSVTSAEQIEQSAIVDLIDLQTAVPCSKGDSTSKDFADKFHHTRLR